MRWIAERKWASRLINTYAFLTGVVTVLLGVLVLLGESDRAAPLLGLQKEDEVLQVLGTCLVALGFANLGIIGFLYLWQETVYRGERYRATAEKALRAALSLKEREEGTRKLALELAEAMDERLAREKEELSEDLREQWAVEREVLEALWEERKAQIVSETYEAVMRQHERGLLEVDDGGAERPLRLVRPLDEGEEGRAG